ncbi:MAG: ATP-binding protein [Muribaculaceae bacterium]|nr:ATP-binding protein [Muribaculaceae bacterium]MDE6753232.1 ATP-binding protein [Muribaculaceae bacterium]
MIQLRRKIDSFLDEWKNRQGHKPLVVKGARQIGKTYSIDEFGKKNYTYFISINFILQPEYKAIFDNGYDVDSIIKNISFINPSLKFAAGETLIFFDELQNCPSAATSLKSFAIDGRFDVICSGSLMGINYNEIESNAVGYKEDYEMFSLDFEEFLWARGYTDEMITDVSQYLFDVKPLPQIIFGKLSDIFKDYMVVGGMPAVVDSFISQGNFSGTLSIQRQLLLDYQEDITKYAVGLDKGKILNVYNHISTFLAQENKKFRISKVGLHARNRDYIGVVDWLGSAGIVNVCYCLDMPELPLKGNYNPDMFKLYYQDTGLLVASLDEEAQIDLRVNRNFSTYKGALYENVVADMLRKAGYGLYYYRNEKSTVEMDFFIRSIQSLVPLEVKANDGATRSLQNLTDGRYPDIKFGIKLCNKNIGFNDRFYTIPYFLVFALKAFLRTR